MIRRNASFTLGWEGQVYGCRKQDSGRGNKESRDHEIGTKHGRRSWQESEDSGGLAHYLVPVEVGLLQEGVHVQVVSHLGGGGSGVQGPVLQAQNNARHYHDHNPLVQLVQRPGTHAAGRERRGQRRALSSKRDMSTWLNTKGHSAASPDQEVPTTSWGVHGSKKAMEADQERRKRTAKATHTEEITDSNTTTRNVARPKWRRNKSQVTKKESNLATFGRNGNFFIAFRLHLREEKGSQKKISCGKKYPKENKGEVKPPPKEFSAQSEGFLLVLPDASRSLPPSVRPHGSPGRAGGITGLEEPQAGAGGGRTGGEPEEGDGLPS